MQTATVKTGANAVQPKRFTPLVQGFLDYLRLEKHFSDYTVKSYGADLIQYGQFLSGEIGQHNAEPPLNVVIPESPASLDEKQTKAEGYICPITGEKLGCAGCCPLNQKE